MRKKGRKTKSLFTESRGEVGLLHFRLCHVCLYLNESTQEISGCRKCGETFTPEEVEATDDEIHLISPGDPLEDWDQDEAQVEAEQQREDEGSDADTRPSGVREQSGLNGLRVRW